MSAWSEWKCGAIEEWQYRMECEKEARADEIWEAEIYAKFEKSDEDDEEED